MKTVAIAGTLDTKGQEFLFLKGLIEKLGFSTLTIHIGIFDPQFEPDVSNGQIAEAAGANIEEIAKQRDRGIATEVMAKGMETFLPELYRQGKFDGVISMGGSSGSSIVAPGMRGLPLGVPKVLVSTMASGDTARFIKSSDIIMIPSVVDVAGINSISNRIFSNAAAAIAGMINHKYKEDFEEKPLVAATMFGVTTPCINHAQKYLEERGYEVLVFHATGIGGKTMESLIDEGYFKGVLDITTTEWCDEIVGGIQTAGPNRSEAASRSGIPQVVSVGAMDMVNFASVESMPDEFSDRNLYKHNPTTTLMRTTVEETIKIGKKLGEKLNLAKDNIALFLPLGGVSSIDVPDGPFYGPDEDKALFNALKSTVNSTVEVVEMECNINDKAFAEAAARKLLEMMEQKNI